MSQQASFYPARLGALAPTLEQLFTKAKIERHPLFQTLVEGAVTDAQRLHMALQIYHVVRCFPRFLAAALVNIEEVEDRMALVGNLFEEHGNGDAAKAHVKNYVDFLVGHGCPPELIAQSRPLPEIVAYNRAIIDHCLRSSWLEGVAAIGVIEDIVARVSPLVSMIAGAQTTGGREAKTFFDEHETLDVAHALEIYEVVAPHYHGENRILIDRGLNLGLYYHARMYEDVLRNAKICGA